MSLRTDNMKTTLPLFPDLLKRYKVLLYQGHFDLRDGVVFVLPCMHDQTLTRDSDIGRSNSRWYAVNTHIPIC